MRAKTTMCVSVVFLMLSLLSVAQPAAAAPAQPYNVSECFDFEPENVFCYKARGVYQESRSASGNIAYTFNETFSYTVSSNGSVRSSGSYTNHFTFVAKNGESQVTHSLGSGSFSDFDSWTGEEVTCTYDYNVIYANGAVRHEVYNFECN